MLLSVALILLCGMSAGFLVRRAHLPALTGMIVAGIVIGPYVLNWLSEDILAISSQLRKIALIIILLRAGLKLTLDDLKTAGKPAVLMCFVPALFEIAASVMFAPAFFGISVMEAAVLGTVLGAVSPAVIVPGMIRLIDEGYGTDKAIPHMILAGASVDDVFVIVLFTTAVSLVQGGTFRPAEMFTIPLSIITGIGAGLLCGYLLAVWFKKINVRDTVRVIILFAVSFLLTAFEDSFGSVIPFASLRAIMAAGFQIRSSYTRLALKMTSVLDRMWVAAEIFLFVLLGASVEIQSALTAGLHVIAFLFVILLFRMAGVFLCMSKTNLSMKERLFCMIAYIPKATVQAAIGGIPLSLGLACGPLVLTVSVIAILVSAPLGAIGIESTYRYLLEKNTVRE